ncbi:MAG: hypothetical protein DHS20C16_28390 [Phycisphaerae bacterium]|nr:MAG: hypothetical protein DHS20C16_28390 [Phycisphaerae bacterium]
MRFNQDTLRKWVCMVPLGLLAIGCTPTVPSGDGDGDGDGDSGPQPMFVLCDSPGGEDADIDFSGFGETKVTFSTFGHGRHLVYFDGVRLIFQFDQPIPFCAVIPDNVKLWDVDTGDEIPLTDAQLMRQNIDANGANTDIGEDVEASLILIDLPGDLEIGKDYELTFDDETLGLDGDFQQNPDTPERSNGKLPSGDDTPGTDFKQIFRTISASDFLTETQGIAGIALDNQDRLFGSSETGAFGPFTQAKAVTGGDQLAPNLNSLASKSIVIDNQGMVIVKDQISDNEVYAIDPDTGLPNIVAIPDVESQPDDVVIAPTGYASVQRSAVEPGDIIYSSTGNIVVADRRAGAGNKGTMNLVDRAGSISDAYTSLFVPGANAGQAECRTIYGLYKPENDTGYEMHRILPDGTVDHSGFTNPESLTALEGTAAVKLQNIQGREEYLIVGDVDLAQADLRQNLPDFDGRCVMIYNETESRLQVLFPLPIDTFAFTFGPFSDAEITSDYDTTYISLPNDQRVVSMTGFANNGKSEGTPECDPSFDDNITVATGAARVFRSTLGNGRFLMYGSPTVLQFDFDQAIPHCSVNADNITLVNQETGADISLEGQRMRRWLFSDPSNGVTLGSRLTIDLPMGLETGMKYEIHLNAEAMGLDGEFLTEENDIKRNGRLPSGDGTPGGDFVQMFQLIHGDWFLTETGGARGVSLTSGESLWASTDVAIMGPFTAPTTPTVADSMIVGVDQEIAGSEGTAKGKPMVANKDAARADVTYASLRNSRLYDADSLTGFQQIFQVDFGEPGLGTFEQDLEIAPDGFAGDYVDVNLARGVIIDVAGSTSTALFESDSQLVQYKSLFVAPDSLGGGLFASVSEGFGGGFRIREITPAGDQIDEFAALAGVNGCASMKLQSYHGDPEYLILGDFDRTSANLLTGQLSDTTSGNELVWYSPAQNKVQVLGSFSLGADMTFEQALDTIYSSHPNLRSVFRFQGLGNDAN